MKAIVTGSIATDHLMVFPGRFADSLMEEQLSSISVSFLANDLQVRRGGSAANIAFGMGQLGLQPILVGAVGPDFADYRAWLDRHGVDTASVHVSEVHQTARFVCTTDRDGNQIATFYAGAMSEAREIELTPVFQRADDAELVMISPNDPIAMQRHAEECRFRGIPFAADPSQQLSSMDAEEILGLLKGAALLFNNEYEEALIHERTGLTSAQVLDLVPLRITTLGPKGSRIESADGSVVEVGCALEERKADPTGVGDAFRAGVLAGMSWEVGWERCAQLGSMLATLTIETVGTQEYSLESEGFLARLEDAYGPDAMAEIAPHLRSSVR
ncbi:MAG: carbohydrate kinase family protein [Actinobacteria bacterium]|nr:carbohydrate kinase family protein [Actinomycetota bacterium]